MSKTTPCVRPFPWRVCILTDVRVTDYPRTLREWGYRFEENFKGEIVENLIQEHPQLSDPKSLEAFRRKWHYMFEYAAAGYAKAYTALNCWTFARPVSGGASISMLLRLKLTACRSTLLIAAIKPINGNTVVK